MTNIEKFKEVFGFTPTDQICVMPKEVECPAEDCGQCEYGGFWYDEYKREGMTKEEIEELIGLAASMGLYDDKKPCKRAVILGKAIKALQQEPCEDCISRQAVLDLLQMKYFGKELYMSIYNLPSVTPQPKTGRWITLENRFDLGDRVKCSECGQVFVVGDDVSRKYCPNCGSKMQEVEEWT